MTKPCLFSCFLLLLIHVAQGQPKEHLLPEARLTIHVVDESGDAVQNASVRLGFLSRTNREVAHMVTGLTDSLGVFTGQGGTESVVGCDVRKDGFYLGGAPIPPFMDATNEQWQPWGATYTTVLRKIENPTPMYARKVFLHVPRLGEPCGYDLKESDWVSPWGRGLVADFIFTMNCNYTNSTHQDISMRLTFSNPLDGIQPANLPNEWAHSDFVWHRQAPDTGYLGSYEMEFGLPDKGFKIPDVQQVGAGEQVEALKYYFRVRTIVRDGQIVSALYGKLSQGFFIRAADSTNTNVRTCYYLNPRPLDRNMEFDLKQNLFTHLKFAEQPRKP